MHAQFADHTWWYSDSLVSHNTLQTQDCAGDAMPLSTELLLCDLTSFINASTIRNISGALRIRGPAYMMGTNPLPDFSFPLLEEIAAWRWGWRRW